VDYKAEDFTFTNNILRRSTYGLRYDKSPGGMQAEGLTSWTLGTSGASTFAKNVVAGGNCAIYPNAANNYCPSDAAWQLEFENFATGNLRLDAASVYRNAGTDGKDLGADVAAVDALTSIALSGDNRNAPSTAPAPSPPTIPKALRIATGW
jgi:hypothetical protein